MILLILLLTALVRQDAYKSEATNGWEYFSPGKKKRKVFNIRTEYLKLHFDTNILAYHVMTQI